MTLFSRFHNIDVNQASNSDRLHIDLKSEVKGVNTISGDIRTHWSLTGRIWSWFGKSVELKYLDTNGTLQKKYVNVASLFKKVYLSQLSSKEKIDNFYDGIREVIQAKVKEFNKGSAHHVMTVDECLNELDKFLHTDNRPIVKKIKDIVTKIWDLFKPISPAATITFTPPPAKPALTVASKLTSNNVKDLLSKIPVGCTNLSPGLLTNPLGDGKDYHIWDTEFGGTKVINIQLSTSVTTQNDKLGFSFDGTNFKVLTERIDGGAKDKIDSNSEHLLNALLECATTPQMLIIEPKSNPNQPIITSMYGIAIEPEPTLPTETTAINTVPRADIQALLQKMAGNCTKERPGKFTTTSEQEYSIWTKAINGLDVLNIQLSKRANTQIQKLGLGLDETGIICSEVVDDDLTMTKKITSDRKHLLDALLDCARESTIQIIHTPTSIYEEVSSAPIPTPAQLAAISPPPTHPAPQTVATPPQPAPISAPQITAIGTIPQLEIQEILRKIDQPAPSQPWTPSSPGYFEIPGGKKYNIWKVTIGPLGNRTDIINIQESNKYGFQTEKLGIGLDLAKSNVISEVVDNDLTMKTKITSFREHLLAALRDLGTKPSITITARPQVTISTPAPVPQPTPISISTPQPTIVSPQPTPISISTPQPAIVSPPLSLPTPLPPPSSIIPAQGAKAATPAPTVTVSANSAAAAAATPSPDTTPPDSQQMTDLLKKIAKSKNSDALLFKHGGKEFAIWHGILPSGESVVNIQSFAEWNKGNNKTDAQGQVVKLGVISTAEKLGFRLDKTNHIISTQVDGQFPSIDPTRVFLLKAIFECINNPSLQIDLHSSLAAVPAVTPPSVEPIIDIAQVAKTPQMAALLNVRKPLIDELKKYFDLDDQGRIKGFKSGVTEAQAEKALSGNEAKIGDLFYQVSLHGDAAYAEDIRTTLSGLNISSTPVDKDAGNPLGKAHNTALVRPVSFVKGKSLLTGKVDPATYNSGNQTKPAYITAWGNAIWMGNRDRRHKELNYQNTTDKKISLSQLVDYEGRVKRIYDLHEKCELVCRVANTAEVKDFIGHRNNMGNDILSTTQLPGKGFQLTIKLFCENAGDTVGLLLDPNRVGKQDFGVSFKENAVTYADGFQNNKSRIAGRPTKLHGIKGADSFKAQQDLFAALEAAIKDGWSVNDLQITLKPDGSGYDVKKPDARTGAVTAKSKQVLWNEQTIYRGISRDCFTAFFVKSESDNFSTELKQLFELQERTRAKKGMYIPIFQFKGSTNELEELIPDSLLLSITGATNVTPITNRKSRFSLELEKAGIDEKMAINMSKAISVNDPALKTIKSLFDLQLLMFNMKDVTGKMTVAVEQPWGGVSFDPVRVLDNLHLVFPTIHETQNTEAKQKKLFFSPADILKIKDKKNTDLSKYLQTTLKYNLNRFLGISVNGSNITFDKKSAELFSENDPKKLDFAKVLSRAVQSAVLFQIYGNDTNETVKKMVEEVRKTWPNIGITPGGIDMILGSEEMQKILTDNGSKKDALGPNLEPDKTISAAASRPIPASDYTMDALDPFKALSLPTKEKVQKFLKDLGINQDGTIFNITFTAFKDSDPHLFGYETAILQAVQMLAVLKEDKLAKDIIDNIRNKCPAFGFTAVKDDSSLPKSDVLMRWLQENIAGQPHQTEFPFTTAPKGQAASAAPVVRGRGRFAQAQMEEEVQSVPFRGRGRFAAAAMGAGGAGVVSSGSPSAIENQPKLDAKGYQDQIEVRKLIPAFNADQLIAAKKQLAATQGLTSDQLAAAQSQLEAAESQLAAAQRLGLVETASIVSVSAAAAAAVDPIDNRLWMREPKFHDSHSPNPVNPKNPYIAVKDLLGHNIAQLMTGPALDPNTLAENRASFSIKIDPDLIPKGTSIEHLITDTLAVTTEGDRQVLRPNGLQYSQAVTVPGNTPPAQIKYNAGNEKHDFRRTEERRFHDSKINPSTGQKYVGAYSNADLAEIEKPDELLLSDEERRIKRAGLLAASYVTISAEGGFGSERKPLDRGYKAYYLATAGAQFEKYGRGAFTYQSGKTDANELEATDFIIKPGAKAVNNPLFPAYYANGKIPEHGTVHASDCSVLNDQDFSKLYVKLLDGGLFNREAFQKANDKYLTELVIPKLNNQMKNGPFYLKATLFGGGFFAEAGKAGNLRSEVVNTMLKSYIKAINNGLVPAGSAIEFPRYGAESSMPAGLIDALKKAAGAKGVELIWTNEGDICDFKPQTSMTGNTVNPVDFEQLGKLAILGAADAMSWHGNEPSSASVEAAFGNNSNLRLVMNWWANAKAFDEAKKAQALVKTS